MLQVANSIQNSSVLQEKNKDDRLQVLLEADRKRDEMFLVLVSHEIYRQVQLRACSHGNKLSRLARKYISTLQIILFCSYGKSYPA